MRVHWLLSVSTLILVAGLTTAQAALAQTFNQTRGVTTRSQAVGRTPLESGLRPHQQQLRAQSGQIQASATPDSSLVSPGGAAPNFAGFYAAPLLDKSSATSIATVTGDFNNDGKPDIANVADGAEITIWLNDGNGRFGAPVVSPVIPALPCCYAFQIKSAMAVELNGDGYTDIVLLGSSGPYQSPVLIILINETNGAFAPTVLMLPNLSQGNSIQSYSQVVGKTTSSGHMDIVTAEQYFPDQIVLRTFTGDGAGVFTPQPVQTFTAPPTEKLDAGGPMNLLLNDANNDGKQDLLLERQAPSDAGLYVDILLGNGDGTFQPPAGNATVNFPWSKLVSPPKSVLIALSLTGNLSKADLIFNNGSEVFVAMSNGDGTFQKPNQVLQAGNITQIQVADLNGDGKPDLVTVRFGGLVSYLGNGDGTFGAIAGTAVANGDPLFGSLEHTVIADFNGDGKIDFANGDSNGNVEVGFGNGDGTFVAAPLLYSANSPILPPSGLMTQAAGDLNGDGLTDLIAMGSGGLISALTNAKGGFTYRTALSYSAYRVRFIAPVTRDFNGDGNQDVVLIGWGGTAAVALSNGDGTLRTPVNSITPAVTLACDLADSAVGDVDGDGKLDLVFAYEGDSSCQGGTTVASGYFVVKGNGDGTFQSPIFYPLGTYLYRTRLGYFHGKNQPLDLVIGHNGIGTGNMNTSILTGKGDGTFGTADGKPWIRHFGNTYRRLQSGWQCGPDIDRLSR